MGKWNRAGARFKVGWDKSNGANVFRFGIGRKSYYNVNRARTIVVSRFHINLFRVPHR